MRAAGRYRARPRTTRSAAARRRILIVVAAAALPHRAMPSSPRCSPAAIEAVASSWRGTMPTSPTTIGCGFFDAGNGREDHAARRRPSRRREHPGASARRSRRVVRSMMLRTLKHHRRRLVAESYDVIIIGSGPGGYVTAIRSAQLGLKTAIVEREHLGGICSELGLHPDQGAAALGRDLALRRARQELWPQDRRHGHGRHCRRRRPLAQVSAQRMNGGVGFLMKKNKVDVIWGEAKLTKPNEIVVSKTAKKPMEPQASGAQEHDGRGHLHRQTHHHRHRRAAARAARHRAGRQADLDLLRGDGAEGDAEIAAGHGLGRHRHRVRLLLSHHGRRRDGGRALAAGHAGRGCRDLELRAKSSSRSRA